MPASSAPLLVTGTGVTGGEVLRRWRAAGRPARALVRDPAKAEPFARLGVDLVPGDFARPDSWARALDGVEQAFVITPIHRDAEAWFGAFLGGAKAGRVRHVVKLSGWSVSPDSPAELHRQMGRTDDALAASGLGHTILRPNVFHQNMLAMAGSIRAQGRFALAAGEARISMIDIRDIADAAVAALGGERHLGRIYGLTGPEALTYHDVARELSAATGRPIAYVPVSAEAALKAQLDHGVPEWTARIRVELHCHFASGDFAPVTGEVAALLGRAPRRFGEFAREHARMFG
jgi:uncharacterized protein YbjT (DUF2867 family)